MIIAKFNITSTFKKGMIYAKEGDEVVLIEKMENVAIYQTVKTGVRFSLSDFSLLMEVQTIKPEEQKVNPEIEKPEKIAVVFATPAVSSEKFKKKKSKGDNGQIKLF